MNVHGSSELLYQFGLDSLDLGYFALGTVILAILVVILFILLILQIVKTGKLKKRLDKFLLGKEGMSLEQEIIALFEDNQLLKNNKEKNEKDIHALYKRMESVYQKMGLVRYDAFSQMGGQLSYSLALLDENDNGFIINSIHSTEGCYSYSKEIKNGDNISLSAEEAEALSIAKSKTI